MSATLSWVSTSHSAGRCSSSRATGSGSSKACGGPRCGCSLPTCSTGRISSWKYKQNDTVIFRVNRFLFSDTYTCKSSLLMLMSESADELSSKEKVQFFIYQTQAVAQWKECKHVHPWNPLKQHPGSKEEDPVIQCQGGQLRFYLMPLNTLITSNILRWYLTN